MAQLEVSTETPLRRLLPHHRNTTHSAKNGVTVSVGESSHTGRRVRVLDRIQTRVSRDRLDAELAKGVPPDSSVVLSLRAKQLLTRSERLGLVRSLRRILSTSEQSNTVRLGVPLNRDAIRNSRQQLEQLIDKLEGDLPVDVRSMASLHNLVVDGGSPLYLVSRSRDLKAELTALLAVVETTPDDSFGTSVAVAR